MSDSLFSAQQVLNQALDRSDPNSPKLRTTSAPSAGSTGSNITGGGAGTAVPVSTSSAPIAAANANRTRLWLKNDGPNTVYLNHSAAAVLASGFPLLSGERMLMDGPEAKLAWNGVCASAESASIRVMTGTVA